MTMGALDECYCEYDLPLADAPREGWQTKDFVRDGRMIIIRRDGTLWQAETVAIPNANWQPTPRIGMVIPWRPDSFEHVCELPPRPAVPEAHSVRIYTHLEDGRFAEVFFDIDAAGRVCNPKAFARNRNDMAYWGPG